MSVNEWTSAPWRAPDAAGGVVAAFVVGFDATRGNTILFQHPPEAELAGLEFKVGL